MTTSITIQGREFTVTYDQPQGQAEGEFQFQTPYLLMPVNRKGGQTNYRLLRNKPNPAMLFPIGNKPFSAGGTPKWWVREVSPGVIVPA
jgi:hypothetical protein